ncbi:MAG: tRNA pseudouridine(38-40) synthase TruA [Candidatus Marinimicrobia bacterium]|nr:tRNA pseudouridine(38-40) synthase TruA [Candidatus Neomarinimicrobiota bacterium]
MSRYKIIIQYDGTNYFGWQMQSHERTIQKEIETALAPLNNDKRVIITGAGRTDAGVHAFGQVAHFDLDTNLKIPELLKALNARLPLDIKIIDLVQTNDEFHARFSAKRRHYRYQCYLGDNLLFKNQSWFTGEIEKSKLEIFAEIIMGTHDFLSFSKLNKQLENTICSIYQSKWFKTENMLIFNVCGNRFLHHMVRYMVGTMVAGAQDKISLDYFDDLLTNPQKNVKIFKAPPEGLILIGIDYDE